MIVLNTALTPHHLYTVYFSIWMTAQREQASQRHLKETKGSEPQQDIRSRRSSNSWCCKMKSAHDRKLIHTNDRAETEAGFKPKILQVCGKSRILTKGLPIMIINILSAWLTK